VALSEAFPIVCRIIDRVLDVPLRNACGEFLSGAYRTLDASGVDEHLLLYMDLKQSPTLLRINSACFTSDLFGCCRCDCNWQLQQAMGIIANERQGLLIYHLGHEGRGNGLIAKLRSQVMSDATAMDSPAAYRKLGYPADNRSYESAVAILNDLSVDAVRLISNSPPKRAFLEGRGIKVEGMIPVVSPRRSLEPYYRWKQTEFGHELPRSLPQPCNSTDFEFLDL
jgi:3,4-dihydroxy 2-butanone 4-phosphate synthase / GTP cyclohydrolase II